MEKFILEDNVHLHLKLIQNNNRNNNFIPEKRSRSYKVIKNLVKTIGLVKFVVKPKNNKDGEGFSFNFIEIIDRNTCQLSFMFEVIFILPIKLIKKIYIITKKQRSL